MASYDATSPLFAGVTTLSGYYKDTVTLNAGATALAIWDSTELGVAVKGNAVSINEYLGDHYGPTWSGDYGRLIVNAGNVLGRHLIAVTKTGSGKGTVKSSTGGINCGAVCSTALKNGTTTTLTASSGDRYSYFTGWRGACSGRSPCALTPTGNVALTATFVTSKTSLKIKSNNKNGTAIAAIRVRGAGKLVLSGRGVVKISKKVKKAGIVRLKIRTTGRLRRKLAAVGSARAKLKIVFTPTGGKSQTVKKSVTLKKS
jgi:hypothetical protein